MRIEINKEGHLLLERGGKMKPQHCPMTRTANQYAIAMSDKLEHCGDWCPLFREPYYFENDKVMEVALCRGAHQCKKEDFTDRRGK